jgi:predicted lipoprotein with Yx(FWY)xxD motif
MRRRAVLSLFPVGAAFAIAACGGASHPSAISVRTAAQQTPAQAQRSAPSPGGPSGTAITVRNSSYGQILADGADRTIYLFTRDGSTASTCYGACASAWPPVLTQGTPRLGHGLTDHLGTTRRGDGRLQVTYSGHPLYYYVGDVQPGEILCQNVEEYGGTWLVVSRSGRAVQ